MLGPQIQDMRSYYKVYFNDGLTSCAPYKTNTHLTPYGILIPHKLYNDFETTGLDRPSFFDSAVPRILQYDHLDFWFADGSPGETIGTNTLLFSWIFQSHIWSDVKLAKID